MKKAFFILLVFCASMLNAQDIRPYGFAGKDQRAFLEPGDGNTVIVSLGEVGDKESFFYWELVDGPDNGVKMFLNRSYSYCDVMIQREGLYYFKVTRVSMYGLQFETVFAFVTNSFTVISITPKSGMGCITGGDKVLKVSDFDFVTDPVLKNPTKYIKFNEPDMAPDGDNLEIESNKMGVFEEYNIHFKQLCAKEYYETIYTPVQATAKVYAPATNTFSINSLNGKTIKTFVEKKGAIPNESDVDKIKRLKGVYDLWELNDKGRNALSMFDKIAPTGGPHCELTGGIGLGLAFDCCEDKPAVKFTITPNVTFNAENNAYVPIPYLSIPGTGGLYAKFGYQVSVTLCGNFDLYFPLLSDGSFCGSIVPSSVEGKFNLAGKIGITAMFIHEDFLSGTGEFVPYFDFTLMWADDGQGIRMKPGGVFHVDVVFTFTAATFSPPEYRANLF